MIGPNGFQQLVKAKRREAGTLGAKDVACAIGADGCCDASASFFFSGQSLVATNATDMLQICYRCYLLDVLFKISQIQSVGNIEMIFRYLSQYFESRLHWSQCRTLRDCGSWCRTDTARLRQIHDPRHRCTD